MKSAVRFFVAACLVVCLFQTGYADLYSFTGTLSTAEGELVADNRWGTSGVRLTFEVNQLESGLWSYKYTFTTGSGAPLSVGLNDLNSLKPFLKIETSNVAGSSYYLVTASGNVPLTVITEDPGFHLWGSSSGDVYFTNEPHLKVGESSVGTLALSDGIIEIISTQAPMWGDFYLRGFSTDGANTQPEVLNRGFNEGVFPNPNGGAYYGSVGGAPVFNPDTYNPNIPLYWILVPDTQTNFNTPLPAAVWLLGSGLIGLIGLRRFRKK